MNLLSLAKKRLKAGVLDALPDRWIYRNRGGTERSLYLTFDDGPDPEFTPRLMTLLREYDAKATFFLLGARIERAPDVAQMVVDNGHQLGNHTYSHINVRRQPLKVILGEIDQTEGQLQELDGKSTHLFRPPSGRLSLRLFRAMHARRQTIAYWSFDSQDSDNDGPEAIVRRFQHRPVEPGDVVLFHDDNEDTLTALGQLLPVWKSAGFQLKCLEEADA